MLLEICHKVYLRQDLLQVAIFFFHFYSLFKSDSENIGLFVFIAIWIEFKACVGVDKYLNYVSSESTSNLDKNLSAQISESR